MSSDRPTLEEIARELARGMGIPSGRYGPFREEKEMLAALRRVVEECLKAADLILARYAAREGAGVGAEVMEAIRDRWREEK